MGFTKLLPPKSAALRIVTASLFSISLTSTYVSAQSSAQAEALVIPAQFVEDAGASQRVDFAGKLRMLSQRVVAAGCAYQAGIVTEQSGATLQAASIEFDVILNALVDGNEDLGIIGAEERRKTLYGMNKLRELWEPMAAVAAGISPNDGNVTAIADLSEQSAPVLEMAKVMVSEIAGQYANQAELLQSDALAIDIAGRQRMLSQRMSKNVCLVGSGISVDAAKAELAATAQIFETSLFALRDGMVQAGINPPPNDAIYEGLTVVVADWNRLKPIVDATIAGNALDIEQREIMFTGANQMTGNMNKVVGMYSEASKLGL